MEKKDFPNNLMKELGFNYADLDDIVLSINDKTSAFDIAFLCDVDGNSSKVIYRDFSNFIEYLENNSTK